MNFHKKTSHNTIKEIVLVICKYLFPNRNEIMECLLNIVKYNKLINHTYIEYTNVMEFLKIIQTISNILVFDNTGKYDFIKEHLRYTYNIIQKICIHGNDLN